MSDSFSLMIADAPSHMQASWHNDAVQKREESIPSFERSRFEDGQTDQIVPSSAEEFIALALVLATGTARQNGETIEAER
jgi:hypothetical protein